MTIRFYKYQGTGNDFIMVDDRDKKCDALTSDQILSLCDRRFGIGADGLILLRNSKDYDFEMVYFNSDGHQSSMCGNGGRCILRFAHDLGLIQSQYSFMAIDGLHKGIVDNEEVYLQMQNVDEVKDFGGPQYFLNTGSPHHIVFTEEMPGAEFVPEARKIRREDPYKDEGVNVNYVRVYDDMIEMRTYERGVEDETLSCGTGVTAAVLAAHHAGRIMTDELKVKTSGGNLRLKYQFDGQLYHDIWLIGTAKFVFKGEVEI